MNEEDEYPSEYQAQEEEMQEDQVQEIVIKEIHPNKYSAESTLSDKDKLNETNWAIWSKQIILIPKVCQIQGYIHRSIKWPNLDMNANTAVTWNSNEKYARLGILKNISNKQVQHIDEEQSAADIWKSLVSLYQATRFWTALTFICKLFNMCAAENKNIPAILNKMKSIVDHINLMKSKFKISDLTYAGVIVQSLNSSWDQWLKNNVESYLTANESNHSFSIVQFQCKLKDEYYWRNGRKEDEALHRTHQANISVTQFQHLLNQISGNIMPVICKNCNRCGHATADTSAN